MLLALAAVAVGVLILWKSADEFVAGATRLALILRLSPIVIGALVVGFGTSAPELLVSALAASRGDTDVGIGNIIGSNIANLSLILGAASLILTMPLSRDVLRREAPLSTGAVLLFAVALTVGLNPVIGVLLLVVLAGALWLIIAGGSPELEAEVGELVGDQQPSAVVEGIRTLVAMALTVAGAWVLVWGALDLADRLGVGGGFIGLTLVAIGTSLPELVTAIAAARAHQAELIVGNLLGSNLFNSLAVGGVVGLLGGSAKSASDADWTVGNSFMVVVAVGAFIAMLTRRKFERFEGVILLAVFAGFLLLTSITEAS